MFSFKLATPRSSIRVFKLIALSHSRNLLGKLVLLLFCSYLNKIETSPDQPMLGANLH